MYIYENKNWPKFYWDNEQILKLLSEVKLKEGFLLGKMDNLGFEFKAKAKLYVLTEDVVKSSEIEGEILNEEQVRFSIAKRLGINIGCSVVSECGVEGIVEMMLDATQNYSKPMTKDRLCGWQASIFPGGYSGMYKIKTGEYRDDANGPMQIISGAIGNEKVHFEAPKASVLDYEMNNLIEYINNESETDLLIKSGIVHLWFVIVHPFSDGNGRIARALADMFLARSENSSNRFYSMSSQIKKVKKSYYKALEITQRSSLDITSWLIWYLETLLKSIENADILIQSILQKAYFWQKHQSVSLNERQIKVLNRVLDDFEGKLTTKKWAKMTNCSQDTATRDISDLIAKNMLIKQGEARATHYMINFD